MRVPRRPTVVLFVRHPPVNRGAIELQQTLPAGHAGSRAPRSQSNNIWSGTPRQGSVARQASRVAQQQESPVFPTALEGVAEGFLAQQRELLPQPQPLASPGAVLAPPQPLPQDGGSLAQPTRLVLPRERAVPHQTPFSPPPRFAQLLSAIAGEDSNLPSPVTSEEPWILTVGEPRDKGYPIGESPYLPPPQQQ